MADIRINALATTATSAASDDYLALDGSANGTRKILATNVAQNVTDVTFGASGPSAKSSINARAARQGLVFDGTAGATVSVPAFGTGDFTVAAWVNPTLSASSNLISGNAASNVPQIAVTTNGTVAVANQGVGTIVSSSAGALVANKTKLVVWRRASGTSYLYIDGIEIGSAADTSNFSTGVGNIGSRGFYGGETFIGTLSVLIYNRALSAAEVVSLFEAGVPSAADYNSASSTNIITGDAWYTTVQGGTAISSGVATITTPGNLLGRATAVTVGKRYRVSVNITASTGGAVVRLYEITTATNRVIGSAAGTNTLEFTATSAGQYFNISAGTATFDTITLIPVGLLLAPDAGQAGGGLTWYDTSGNAANITLPASGVAWAVPTSGNVTSGGALNLLAGGTNQNITLTPSGTGSVALSSTGANVLTILRDITNTGVGTAIKFRQKDSASATVDICDIYAYKSVGTAGSVSSWLGVATRNAGTLTDAMFIAPSGNIVLGSSATDSGNGKVQLATHTTSAGGIGFGTDTSFYRAGAGALYANSSGSTNLFGLAISGTRKSLWYFDATDTLFGADTGALKLISNGATALTLSSSQNMTVEGTGVHQLKGTLLVGNQAAIGASLDVQTASGTASTFRLYQNGVSNWVWSVPASTDALVLSQYGTTEAMRFDSSRNAIFTGAIAIGNTVNTVSPTSPNRTITIVIGGTTYYIPAKTTND